MRQRNSAVVRMFPAVAALAACVWAGSSSAQAAPGSIYGAHSPVPNRSGEGVSGQLPGDAGGLSSAAKLRQQALAAMEALREETATLTALRDAQAALLALNRATPRYLGSTYSGASLQTLPAALCSDPSIGAWCPLLPATFGASHTPSSGHTASGGYTEDGDDRD